VVRSIGAMFTSVLEAAETTVDSDCSSLVIFRVSTLNQSIPSNFVNLLYHQANSASYPHRE